MTPTDIRATVALVAPYTVILAAMAFAKWGVDATIISLIAGGCLAAIDPRRGQSASNSTTTVETRDATVTTEPPK